MEPSAWIRVEQAASWVAAFLNTLISGEVAILYEIPEKSTLGNFKRRDHVCLKLHMGEPTKLVTVLKPAHVSTTLNTQGNWNDISRCCMYPAYGEKHCVLL